MNEGIHLDLDTWIVPGQIQNKLIIVIKRRSGITGLPIPPTVIGPAATGAISAPSNITLLLFYRFWREVNGSMGLCLKQL